MDINYNSGTISLTGCSATSGGLGEIGSTSTGTFFLQSFPSRKLEGVQHVDTPEGNVIEITYRETYSYPNYTLTIWPPAPNSTGERMVKEIWGVVRGKLQLIKTVYGKEEPGYYVPPTTIWEE
jgi:hypothetical protein